MTPDPKKSARLFAALLGALIVVLFWSPLLTTPFWQDDYSMLQSAREAAEAGESVFSSFVKVSPVSFWRPLSTGIYGRFANGVLGGSATLMHAMNLLMAGLIAAMAGSLWGRIATLRSVGSEPWRGGAAALWFGLQFSFFLPVAWASGMQELGALFFSLAALRCWIGAVTPEPMAIERRIIAFTPVFLLLALFCKEGPVMVPVLGILLTMLVPRAQWRVRRTLLVGASCLAVTLGWLIGRVAMTTPLDPDSAYGFAFGTNIVRNVVSLGMFLVGVSREDLRLIVEENNLAAVVTAVISGVVGLGMLASLARRSPLEGRGRVLGLLALWVVAALLPYVALRSNCYAYYTLLAASCLPLLVAMAPSRRIAMTAVVLTGMVSAMNLAREFMAADPAPLARAEAAENLHTLIDEQVRRARPTPEAPLTLIVASRSEFLAIGWEHGVLWRNKLSREAVKVAEFGGEQSQGDAILIGKPQ